MGIKLESESIHNIDELHEKGLANEIENTKEQMPTIEQLGIKDNYSF